MKIFHRVLAVVLALIMTMAVLPLGVFASEPWFEVGAETESPDGTGTNTNTTITVKVDAKRLAAILQDTGISPALKDAVLECISVDLDSFFGIVNQDQLLKLIPIELIPMTDIVNALGEDVNLYFDLAPLISDLEPDVLMSLVNQENALPILLGHYKNAEGGLAGLLTTLLASGGAEDKDNDGIPDNCPVKVGELINADFWAAKHFNDGVKNVSIDKYLESGKITAEDILSYWPRANGTYDISFLNFNGETPDVKADLLIEDLEAAGKSLLPYLKLEELVGNPLIVSLIVNDPHKYLTADGYAKIEALAEDAVESQIGGVLQEKIQEKLQEILEDELLDEISASINPQTDLDLNAVAQALGYAGESDPLFTMFVATDPDAEAQIMALVMGAPQTYIKPDVYNAIKDTLIAELEVKLKNELEGPLRDELFDACVDAVLTPENLKTFNTSDFYIDVLRADLEAADPTFDYLTYVKTADFINDNISFLVADYAKYLTDSGIAKIYAKVDMIAIARKIGIGTLIKEEGFGRVIGWLNFDEVLTSIEESGKSIADYVYVNRVLTAIGIDTVWGILAGSGTPLSKIVNIPAAVQAIGIPALLAQLTPEEMKALYEMEVVKKAIQDIITSVLAKLPYIIDEITLNGAVVGKENPDNVAGKLMLDFGAIVDAVADMIPTLEELKNIENDTLFSADFGLTYLLEGEGETPVTKNISVEFVLVGSGKLLGSAIERVQTLLDKYVTYDIDLKGLDFKFDIKLPAKVTELYAKALASDKLSEDLRQKLLLLPDLTAPDAVALLETLNFAEILELLNSISPSAIYDKVMQIKYVELILEKLSAKTNKDLSNLKLEDIVSKLDDLVDKAGSVSLINKVYAAVEEKTGIVVTDILDNVTLDELYHTAINKAEALIKNPEKLLKYLERLENFAPSKLYEKVMQIEFVQKLLAEISGKIGKDLTDIDLEELVGTLDDAVDKAGSVGLINKVYKAVENKTGVNVADLLDEKTLDEIYQAVLDKAAGVLQDTNIIINYLYMAIDMLEAFVPSLLEISISDFYKGNGSFNVSGGKYFEINVKELVERVLAKLPASITSKIPAEALDIVLDMIPEDVILTPSLDLTVRFDDLYRLTYHDIEGKKLLHAFLPAGTDLSIYQYEVPAGITLEGWRLLNGTPVTEVTGDMDVYPVFTSEQHYSVTFKKDNGEIIAILDKLAGDKITAEDIKKITYAYEGVQDAGYTYELVWFLENDPAQTAVELKDYVINENTTFGSRFDKKAIIYTVTILDENGNVFATFEKTIGQSLTAEELASLNLTKEGVEGAYTYRLVWFLADDPTQAAIDLAALTVSGDVSVQARFVREDIIYTVTVLGENGNVLGTFEKIFGEKLTTEEIDSVTHTKAVEEGYERLYRYDLVWYLQGTTTTVNLAQYSVAGNATICARFDKAYLFDGAEDITFEDDKYVLDDVDFDGRVEVLLPDVVVDHAQDDENVGVVISGKDKNGNDVKITIDGETLQQLGDLGGEVAIVYEKNETFQVSYYNQNNADQYTFDFLCGDDEENLASYSTLLGDDKNFAGKVTFELPFTSIAQTATQGTHVYYTDDATHSRTLIDCTVTGTTVIFDAPHFSDFVIANEYAIDHTFVHADPNRTTPLTGTLGIPDNRHFFPKNATVTFTPVINGGEYIASEITWVGGSATKNGNTWTLTMPEQAIMLTIKAEYDVWVTVTFKASATDTKVIRLLCGESLEEALTEADKNWINNYVKAYPTATDKYLYYFTYYWYEEGDANKTKVEISDYDEVTENVTILANFTEVHYIDASGSDVPTDAVVSAEIDGTTYIVKITRKGGADDFTVVLPEKVAEMVAELADATWVIRVVDADTNEYYDALTVNNAMLKKLYENGNKYVSFDFEKQSNYNLASLYQDSNSVAYDLTLKAGADQATAKSVDIIADSITVKLPFAAGIGNSASSQVRVNFIKDGARTYIEGGTFNAGYVTFRPEHFSIYVVANEYFVNYRFVDTNNQAVAGGKLEGLATAGEYYPAGTKITVVPEADGYYVGAVYYVKNGSKIMLTKKDNENSWSFEIATTNAASTELIVELRARTFHIYYYVLQADGTYVLKQTTAYTAKDKPEDVIAGHTSAITTLGALTDMPYAFSAWVGYDATKIAKSDLYVYQIIAYKEYTVNFKDGEELKGTVTITYESLKDALNLPALPTKLGHTAEWAGWADLDLKVAIDDMIKANKTEMDVPVAYTLASYPIMNDGNVTVDAQAQFGADVTVTVTEKPFHTYTLTVKAENGDAITVTDGKFKMPACSVSISVVYEAEDLYYYVNGVKSDKAVVAGDTVSFQIRLENGYRIATISDFCTLADVTVNADGSMLLTYTFAITDADMKAEYTFAAIAYDLISIFNGALFEGEGDPTVEDKNVLFKGWSDPVADTFRFAAYEFVETQCMLWLWILIAVIVLIAIIALLYVLYINEKLKPNFILRFVVWLVSGFFAVCMFIASVGLYLMSKVGKPESDYYLQTEADFEAEMSKLNEEAEAAVEEEAVEEETAEEAVEETEEATEEVTEEATEEATEETDTDNTNA